MQMARVSARLLGAGAATAVREGERHRPRRAPWITTERPCSRRPSSVDRLRHRRTSRPPPKAALISPAVEVEQDHSGQDRHAEPDARPGELEERRHTASKPQPGQQQRLPPAASRAHGWSAHRPPAAKPGYTAGDIPANPKPPTGTADIRRIPETSPGSAPASASTEEQETEARERGEEANDRNEDRRVRHGHPLRSNTPGEGSRSSPITVHCSLLPLDNIDHQQRRRPRAGSPPGEIRTG